MMLDIVVAIMPVISTWVSKMRFLLTLTS
jgi:hypothetical protein